MQETVVPVDYASKVMLMPEIWFVKLSEDSSKVIFISNQSGSNQLWNCDLTTGNVTQISRGEGMVDNADLFPDGKGILFSREFMGKEEHQFFTVPISGEQSETQISNFDKLRMGDFEIAPAGDRVAFTGSTTEGNSLFLYDLHTNEYLPIYKVKSGISLPRWRKDGKFLAASGRTTGTATGRELLFLNPSETDEFKVFTPKPGSDNHQHTWHPSSNRVLFKTDSKNRVYDLATYDLDSGALEYLGLSELGVDFPEFGWMHPKNQNGEDAWWFLVQKNGRTKLYVKQGGAHPEELPTPKGTVLTAELDGADRFFLFLWSSLSCPPRISKIDIETKKVQELYNNVHDRTIPLGKAEFITYPSFDGLTISAFLLRSKIRDTKPGPTVVWVHGGPHMETGDSWNSSLQAICAEGFHVICPNFRGSSGYGPEFQWLDIKDVGGGDMQDVLHAAKYLRDHDILDKEKLAIAGASYGGFMVCLAMTKFPDVFRVGVAISSVTDWEETYGIVDPGIRSSYEEQFFGGKPEGESLALYRDRSPINFVSQLKNPIFIWHRANDARCPVLPVKKFAAKLDDLRKPYEFHVTEGEGHGTQKAENLTRQYSAIVSFLHKQIGFGNTANGAALPELEI